SILWSLVQPRWCSSVSVILIAALHPHPGGAGAEHAQLSCRGKGYVDDAPADKGPAVIDAHRGAAAIEQVGHTQPGTEGQSGMGGGHVRLVVGFAAGGASSMQAGRIVGSASFGGIGQSIVTVRKVGTGGGGAG